MIIKAFCFNPFSENTYIIYQEEGEAWIIDPGCYDTNEESMIFEFLKENNLKLSRLLLTHAHIDHILGLDFVFSKFGLLAEMHKDEELVLSSGIQLSKMYGLNFRNPGHNKRYLIDNQIIMFGETKIECIWTPGHSPGSLCFYMPENKILIGGDVLFEGSIGRTDLPGGHHDTLIKSIKQRLFPLGNDILVYPGHGGTTTIGQEKLTNPFLT